MPCNYKDYPDNWKTEIRPSILERDNHSCVICGVPNYAIGFRDNNGNFQPYEIPAGLTFEISRDIAKGCGLRLIKIVLTIAHLDHDVKNNDYKNLAAMCQLHHITHDKEQHARNARATIAAKKNQALLFNS